MFEGKREASNYSPVPSSDGSDLHVDAKLNHSHQAPRSLRHILGSNTFLAIYSIVLISLTLVFSSMWWSRVRLHGATVVESPLRPAILYEPVFFERGWSANYTLMGPPSPELDAAWDDILQCE